MYFTQIDLLLQNLISQAYKVKLLSHLPPSFKQHGQYCKLLSLSAAMQWSYQQAPEQKNSPPYPTKKDMRNNHVAKQVEDVQSLREQAKKLNSQVGEIYDVRQLIQLANNNGYHNIYYKHYESLASYQQDLTDAINQETMVNVFYDLNVNDGSPIKNNSYSEHSGLVIGYALKNNEPPLAILSTHNEYIALKIQDLFESSIQLQATRKPETFFKDTNKFWRNVDGSVSLANPGMKIRKALPPEKDAVSFRGKMIFCTSNPSHKKDLYLNEELLQFSDLQSAHYSLEEFKAHLSTTNEPDFIPLEILVHFLETLQTLSQNKSTELFERFAREYNFKHEIIQLCLVENETRVSGALMDDIFKQNPETKRSIVEITSNALDAKPTQVQVNISDGAYSVLDDGIGMTAYEIFNHLLVSKISSKNGLVDVIGRFGIGFYTSLAHLKNEKCNVIVKTHSLNDQYGYILHFRWRLERMEVLIKADKALPFGTEVLVEADEIKKADYEPYVTKHFPFVEKTCLTINGDKVVLDKAYRVLSTKNGSLLFKCDEKKAQGSLKIVVANVLISEYFYRESNNNLTIIWKFPNQTTITESRNSILVDNRFIVENIKSFIDAVHELPEELQIKYLNTISPGILAMQEHNALKNLANNLRQYLCNVLAKITTHKKCIPDETEYQFLESKNTVSVSRNILADNWEDQIGYRIEEWKSKNHSVYAVDTNSKKNIASDPYHYVAFLSVDFINHIRKNNLFDYLSRLVEMYDLKGTFSQVENPTEVSTHKVNTYVEYKFDTHHALYNQHGGLTQVDKFLLDQIPSDARLTLAQAPTLVARYPFQGPLRESYSNYEFDTTNWHGVSYQKGCYQECDYFLRFVHQHSWNLLVYDQHFQVIVGEKGKFLTAYFRNKKNLERNHPEILEMKRLIVKNSQDKCQLIDIETKKIILDNLSLDSYYIPIPDSEFYCIQNAPADDDRQGITRIYLGDRAVSSLPGKIRIIPWNNHYLIVNEMKGYSFSSSFKVYLYTKQFECLDSTYVDCSCVYGKIHYEIYHHEDNWLIILHSTENRLPVLFSPKKNKFESLSKPQLIGQHAIEIDKKLYHLTPEKNTMLLGNVVHVFNDYRYLGTNADEHTQSRAVIYTDHAGKTKLFGADGIIHPLPENIEQSQFVSYAHNNGFQSIKLKNGYLYNHKNSKNRTKWIPASDVQLNETSIDSFALINHKQILNSKGVAIYNSKNKEITLETRTDCPYLLINDKNGACSTENKIISSNGSSVLNYEMHDIKFTDNTTNWVITFFSVLQNKRNKKIIFNKNGIIEQDIDLVIKTLQVDCECFIWYPIRYKKAELIATNTYYIAEEKDRDSFYTKKPDLPPYFFKLIDSKLLLDPDVIKNIAFLNSKHVSTLDYSNFLRFIDCEHSLFVALDGYFAIFTYVPTREQFADYQALYQAINLTNPNYLNIGLRLLDLIYYCAGTHSDIVLSNKLTEIIKLHGLAILRDLYEAYSKDTQLLYHHLHTNVPLHTLFPALSNKLREISYFIFSNKTNLLTQNKCQVLFNSASEYKKASILDLITSVSLRKSMLEHASDIESIIHLANTMHGNVNTSLALRSLKHAIYHLSDSSQPIYLREFLQNSLDASSMGMTVNIEFFNQDNYHVSRISDTGHGMNLLAIFAYLIIPGNSSKRGASEFIGGRGVGFFSAFNGAKEINVKTSTGDGITLFLKFEPCYDEDNKICDIHISAYQTDEIFVGTIVDRISSDENAALEAARCLSAIRQYGSFIDANKVKLIVNQTQINKDLFYLGELKFAKIGACRIYSNSECAFTAGGLYIKPIDELYWNNIPVFIMAALKHHGILIDLPSKIALVRERNNFQNADKFIEYFKPLFFQLCLNAYCILLKSGKISDRYLPYDLFDDTASGIYSFATIESIKADISAINQGKLLADYKKYLNHDNCIKLLVNLDFIPYGLNTVSIATINELNNRSQLRPSMLPEFIARRLEKQTDCIKSIIAFNDKFKESKNIYEEKLEKYKYCSWHPNNAFDNAKNWELFYKLCEQIIASIAPQYALDIDVHFSTINPSALAYVEPRNFRMITKNGSPVKKAIIFINPFNWEDALNNVFNGSLPDKLINKLIYALSHEIAHIIEESGCEGGSRAFTHDHFFKAIHAEIYTKMLMQIDIKKLNRTTSQEADEITKSNEQGKRFPTAKEFMIMQILGEKDYLNFFQVKRIKLMG